MQLNAVLKRVGAQIVKERIGEESAIFFLRVDPEQSEKWMEAVTGFLLGASGKPFLIDVSKYFYAAQGAVRYLWRVKVEGDVTTALAFWGSSVMEASMVHAKEVTSFPLVGRARYEVDPVRGKLKGPHDPDQAPALVAMATMGVVPQ